MLIATFMFTVMNVCVKLVPNIPAVEVIFFRSVVSLVISLFFLFRQRVNIWGHRRSILVLRGITGAIALITYFHLLQQIPLATASTLQYLAPIFTAILGVFLVRERVWSWQWLFFAVSFLGIVVIEGFDPRISPLHLMMGVASSFFMGLAYNFIRMLKTSEHPLVIIFYFPLVMLPVTGIWSAFNWVQPVGWEWLILIAVGVFTQIAQFYMTKSYQVAELSKVSIINYTGIIYSLTFGWIFFDESYNLMTYLGMGLVIAGMVANVMLKKSR